MTPNPPHSPDFSHVSLSMLMKFSDLIKTLLEVEAAPERQEVYDKLKRDICLACMGVAPTLLDLVGESSEPSLAEKSTTLLNVIERETVRDEDLEEPLADMQKAFITSKEVRQIGSPEAMPLIVL